MSLASDRDYAWGNSSFLRSPLFWLAAGIAVLPLFLLVRLTIPIGPMYWDLFIYFDAANRIFHGQVPVVDFFVPVGPLGYYLFSGALKLFPNGQPLLLVEWSMLAITGPLMALVLWQMEKRGRGMAFALLVPFLVFSLLPFNTREYFPYPGSDAFGIYNRQVCHLLYVLVAALVFVRERRTLALIVTAAMTALFFTKITGFVAGFMICTFAFAVGRLSLRYAVASALAFFAMLGALQLWDGLVSQYALDILALVEQNSGTLLPRFLRAGSYTFGIVAPASALALLLLWTTRDRVAGQWRELRRAPSWNGIATLLDHDSLWLGIVLFAGVFFETQNTGSQPLIFIWPLILSIIVRWLPALGARPKLSVAIMVLVGATALPAFAHTVHRAVRTYISAAINDPLQSENLMTLGSVNARPEIIDHANDLLYLYSQHQDTYRDFVETDTLPTFMFYLGYDFQIVHMMTIDHAISDIKALEAKKGILFESIMELNFVNPIPYLMDRKAPKYVAIGADPTRAVPKPGSEEENAVRNTDLVLYPTCPLTTDNRDLYELYKPALSRHHRIELDACFDAYVNPRFARKFD